jgi:hypothetical protein
VTAKRRQAIATGRCIIFDPESIKAVALLADNTGVRVHYYDGTVIDFPHEGPEGLRLALQALMGDE